MISSLKLAEICGVSQGSVDRALHNRSGINPDTREKILRTAEKYGYRPNPAAVEMLTGKSSSVCAIIPDLNTIFYMDLLSVIKRKIAGQGFKMMISQYDSKEELLELLLDASARRFCGAVIVPPGENTRLPDIPALKMKILSLLSPMEGKLARFITPDEERTGVDAVDFLLKRGRRRILHVTYDHPDYYAVRMRTEGYRKTMLENGLEPIIVPESRESDFPEAFRRYRPDALFCHNDWLAMKCFTRLRLLGCRIPEDVSILGVDSSPTFNSLFPDLTTMEYPRDWVASEVLGILSGREKPSKPPRFSIVLRKT